MVHLITAQDRQKIEEAMPRVQMDLPPPSIDGAVDGRISLVLLAQGLTVRIPFFEGQPVGQYMHIGLSVDPPGLSWGEWGTISEGDTLFHIPLDRAMEFRGMAARLEYSYMMAPDYPTSPTVSYLAEDEIYRPLVDEARDWVIPLAAANQGVNVRLRASESLSSGALVSLYWHGSAFEGSLVQHLRLTDSDAGKDVVLRIDPRYLRPNKYGTVRLIYTVQNNGRQWVSLLTDLSVEGDLKAPNFVYSAPGYILPGSLEPTEEADGIPVTLSTQGMAVGDAVTYIFSGDKLGITYVLRQTLGPHQVGHDLHIKVPFKIAQLSSYCQAMSIVERVSGEIVGSPLVQVGVAV